MQINDKWSLIKLSNFFWEMLMSKKKKKKRVSQNFLQEKGKESTISFLNATNFTRL